MNKTLIYLCTDTNQLKSLTLDTYFPETELHPVHIPQLVPSLIGKSFCTHNGDIINYISHLIADKVIEPNSVEIHLITYDNIKGKWITQLSAFDSEGYLENWPLGYFEWTYV